MEGVLVSAQKAGSPDHRHGCQRQAGHFRFPGGRLSPGHYTLRIRAIGYDLVDRRRPNLATRQLHVRSNSRKTADLAAQLTNTEWLMSMPGTAEQKRR